MVYGKNFYLGLLTVLGIPHKLHKLKQEKLKLEINLVSPIPEIRESAKISMMAVNKDIASLFFDKKEILETKEFSKEFELYGLIGMYLIQLQTKNELLYNLNTMSYDYISFIRNAEKPEIDLAKDSGIKEVKEIIDKYTQVEVPLSYAVSEHFGEEYIIDKKATLFETMSIQKVIRELKASLDELYDEATTIIMERIKKEPPKIQKKLRRLADEFFIENKFDKEGFFNAYIEELKKESKPLQYIYDFHKRYGFYEVYKGKNLFVQPTDTTWWQDLADDITNALYKLQRKYPLEYTNSRAITIRREKKTMDWKISNHYVFNMPVTSDDLTRLNLNELKSQIQIRIEYAKKYLDLIKDFPAERKDAKESEDLMQEIRTNSDVLHRINEILKVKDENEKITQTIRLFGLFPHIASMVFSPPSQPLIAVWKTKLNDYLVFPSLASEYRYFLSLYLKRIRMGMHDIRPEYGNIKYLPCIPNWYAYHLAFIKNWFKRPKEQKERIEKIYYERKGKRYSLYETKQLELDLAKKLIVEEETLRKAVYEFTIKQGLDAELEKKIKKLQASIKNIKDEKEKIKDFYHKMEWFVTEEFEVIYLFNPIRLLIAVRRILQKPASKEFAEIMHDLLFKLYILILSMYYDNKTDLLKSEYDTDENKRVFELTKRVYITPDYQLQENELLPFSPLWKPIEYRFELNKQQIVDLYFELKGIIETQRLERKPKKPEETPII